MCMAEQRGREAPQLKVQNLLEAFFTRNSEQSGSKIIVLHSCCAICKGATCEKENIEQ